MEAGQGQVVVPSKGALSGQILQSVATWQLRVVVQERELSFHPNHSQPTGVARYGGGRRGESMKEEYRVLTEGGGKKHPHRLLQVRTVTSM